MTQTKVKGMTLVFLFFYARLPPVKQIKGGEEMKIDQVRRSESLMEGHYEMPLGTLESVIRTIGLMTGMDSLAIRRDEEGAENRFKIDWQTALKVDPTAVLASVGTVLASTFSLEAHGVTELVAGIRQELASQRFAQVTGKIGAHFNFPDGQEDVGEAADVGIVIRSSAFDVQDTAAAIQVSDLNFLKIAHKHFGIRQASQTLRVHCILKPSIKQRYAMDLHSLFSGLGSILSEAFPTDQAIEQETKKIAETLHQKWRAAVQPGRALADAEATVQFQIPHSEVPLLLSVSIDHMELTGVSGSVLSGMQIRTKHELALQPRLTLEFSPVTAVTEGVLRLPFTERERVYVSTAITDMVAALRE